MLRRTLIILSITFGLCLFVAAAGLFALDWYLGSDTFKKNFERILSDAYGHPVTFAEELGVSVYPWLGVETGAVRVAGPDGFGDTDLLTASQVTAKVAFLPLFSSRLEFDTVVLTDLKLHVVLLEDGTTNVDQLIRMVDEAARKEVGVSESGFNLSSVHVRGVELENGIVVVDDRESGESLTLSRVQFSTGGFSPDQIMPFSFEGRAELPCRELQAELMLSGEMQADLDREYIRLSGVDAVAIVDGRLLPGESGRSYLAGIIDLDSRDQTAKLRDLEFKTPSMSFEGNLTCENLLTEPTARGRLDGTVMSIRGGVNALFPDLIPDKDPGIFTVGKLAMDVEYGPEGLNLSNIDAFGDETTLDGWIRVDREEDGFVFRYAINGDEIDFDRYWRLFIVDEPFWLSDFGPEFLSWVRSEGIITMNTAQVGGAELTDLTLAVASKDGHISAKVDPANLWGGELAGEFTMDIRHQGGDEFPMAMTVNASVTDARSASLPLLPWTKGRGDMTFSFDMPETVFLRGQVIDDVLSLSDMGLDWALGAGSVAFEAKGKRITFDEAVISATLDAEKKLKPKAGYWFDMSVAMKASREKDPYALSMTLDGRAGVPAMLAGFRINDAALQVTLAGDVLSANGDPAVLTASMGLDTAKQYLSLSDISLQALGGQAMGKVEGHRIFEPDYTWAGPLSLETSNPRLLLKWFGVEPGETRDPGAFKFFSLSGDLVANPERAVLSGMVARLDDSRLEGAVRFREYQLRQVTLELTGGDLDLDPYRGPKIESSENARCDDMNEGEPVPLPLSFMRDLELVAELSLDRLKLYAIHFKNLSASVTASKGEIQASVLSNNFHEGSLGGTAEAVVDDAGMSFNLMLEVENFKAEPFMTDIAGKPYVGGKSFLFFDLEGRGATTRDIVTGLRGRAGFTILDGSYKFSGENGPEVMKVGEESIRVNRTGFDGAAALFRVEHGEFLCRDFAMDSSLITMEGEGGFDLGRDTIDVALNVDYVAIPTVPVKIKGCLSNPAVEVSGGELITNTIGGILGIPLKPFQYLGDIFF